MITSDIKYFSNFFLDSLKEIQHRSRRLSTMLVDMLAEVKVAEVDWLLKETKPMAYSIQAYLDSQTIPDNEKDMLTQAGYNSALLDIMQLYIEKLHVQVEIQKVRTSYRDVVLRTLDKRGTLMHKDLASELGVSPSGLTAVIKQMNSTSVRLINVEVFSKFKVYSLTPVARQYIEKCMPDTPTDFKPSRRYPNYMYYMFGQKAGDVPDGRFGEQDIQSTPLFLVKGDKYNKHTPGFHNNRPQKSGIGLGKFSIPPDAYSAKRA